MKANVRNLLESYRQFESNWDYIETNSMLKQWNITHIINLLTAVLLHTTKETYISKLPRVLIIIDNDNFSASPDALALTFFLLISYWSCESSCLTIVMRRTDTQSSLRRGIFWHCEVFMHVRYFSFCIHTYIHESNINLCRLLRSSM